LDKKRRLGVSDRSDMETGGSFKGKIDLSLFTKHGKDGS
jgi:hypothetical protein